MKVLFYSSVCKADRTKNQTDSLCLSAIEIIDFLKTLPCFTTKFSVLKSQMWKFSSYMKILVLFLIFTLKKIISVKYEEWKPNSKISKVFSYWEDSEKTKHTTPKVDSNMENPAGLTVDLFQGDVTKRELLTALSVRETKPMVSSSQHKTRLIRTASSSYPSCKRKKTYDFYTVVNNFQD